MSYRIKDFLNDWHNKVTVDEGEDGIYFSAPEGYELVLNTESRGSEPFQEETIEHIYFEQQEMGDGNKYTVGYMFFKGEYEMDVDFNIEYDLRLYKRTRVDSPPTGKKIPLKTAFIEVNDHISIRGVDTNDPNHEGRVIEVNEEGVYIANLNMPFMGTYTRHFVAFADVVK